MSTTSLYTWHSWTIKKLSTRSRRAVLEAMDRARIDSGYSKLIRYIYEHATLRVKLEEDWMTGRVKIKRGVQQGDTISPKLFTLALEDVFKDVSWEQKGINNNGSRLSHLRFADDIVLISSDIDELEVMLQELKEAFQKVDLKINLQKTKIMSPDNIQIVIDNHTLERVDEYIYLGHNIKKREGQPISRDHKTCRLNLGSRRQTQLHSTRTKDSYKSQKNGI